MAMLTLDGSIKSNRIWLKKLMDYYVLSDFTKTSRHTAKIYSLKNVISKYYGMDYFGSYEAMENEVKENIKEYLSLYYNDGAVKMEVNCKTVKESYGPPVLKILALLNINSNIIKEVRTVELEI